LQKVDGVDLAACLAPPIADVGQSRQIMPADPMPRLVPAERSRIVHHAVNAGDVEAEKLPAELTMLPT
jgi:hypothetical protein